MKRFALLMMLMIALVGCSADTNAIKINEMKPIRLGELKQGTVEETYVTIGEVIPEERIDVLLPMGQEVMEIFVTTGDSIRVDDELLCLYDSMTGKESVLSSPLNGEILSVNVIVGDEIESNSALTLINREHIYVKTMISKELKDRLESLDLVRIKTEEGISFESKILSIAEEAEPLSRLYETILILPESDLLMVGEYMEVTFVTDVFDTKLIPSKAVVRKNNEKYVYQYINDKLVKLQVETGLSEGEWVELKNTVSHDFVYVISGQNFVTETTKVFIVE